jgi:hypothetical protein
MGNALIAALGRSEELSRDAAARIYRRLLEKPASDEKSVAEMKAAMAVLGLTLTDANNHFRLRDQAKTYQQRITNGAGLGDALAKAGKAIEESMVEKERLLLEWRQRHNQKLVEQMELSNRQHEGLNALRQLKELKLQHAIGLGDLACCDERDLDTPDPLNQSK